MINYKLLENIQNDRIYLNYCWSISEKNLDKIDNLFNIIIRENDSKNFRYLCMPLHRLNKNYFTIILDDDEYTLYRLLNVIYNFYVNYNLSIQELKQLDEDDEYDIISNLINELKKGEIENIYPIDIVSYKHFFEYIATNVDKNNDTQYYLQLTN
jgi:hypothetical protein